MSVEIGSARSSFGNTSPGDQNGGKEVSTQGWYLHSKGWRVFRAKSDAVAEALATCMDLACKTNLIGYDQDTRLQLYNALKTLGFDIRKLKTKVNTDCSALVRVCLAYAGISTKDFNTSGEAGTLMNTGCFVEMTLSKYRESSEYLQRGDILVTKTKGHTVIVLENGSKAEKRGIASKTLTVTGGTYYVRSKPVDGEKLGTVKIGDKLNVLRKDKESGWYCVSVVVKGKTVIGYVSDKAVS